MNYQNKGSRYLLWPLAVLLFLTVSVFFTTKEVPQQQSVQSHAQTAESTDAQNTPGPVISLSFAIPGIASQGGNMNPLHLTRSVTLSLYDPDNNIAAPTTKPLYSVQTQATFNTDPTSPTYASFVKTNITFGTTIPDGDYQIAFKTAQATQTIIKVNPSDIGGEIFSLTSDTNLTLPPQTLSVGDIAPLPDGDNAVDNTDYQAFQSCFGAKFTTASCTAKQLADLDDNGVVDGVDYNLLLASLNQVFPSGFATPTPSPLPTVPVSVTPTVLPTTTSAPSSTNGSMGTLVILIILFAILAGGAFYFLRKVKKKPFDKKEYFIKVQSQDENGYWLTLTDDNGPQLGHYSGKDAQDGFGHIRGVTKTQDGKTFLEVSEIVWEEEK